MTGTASNATMRSSATLEGGMDWHEAGKLPYPHRISADRRWQHLVEELANIDVADGHANGGFGPSVAAISRQRSACTKGSADCGGQTARIDPQPPIRSGDPECRP